MEFLPGNINLDFEGCYVPLTINAGDHLVKSGVLVKLTDSSGHPLAGGVASAYVRGWQSGSVPRMRAVRRATPMTARWAIRRSR